MRLCGSAVRKGFAFPTGLFHNGGSAANADRDRCPISHETILAITLPRLRRIDCLFSAVIRLKQSLVARSMKPVILEALRCTHM